MRMLVLVLALAAFPAWAEDGKALYAARGCVACHGADGARPLAATPALAGQNAAYLERQMTEIADGTRPSPGAKPMRPVIEKTSSADRKMLAQWLAAQKPAEPGPADAAKAEKGALLFEDNGCIGCHGADGAKPLADYPVLAGQRRDYLAIQIKAIRDEVRSTRRARLMVANVRNLKNEEVDQLAQYLSQAKRK